MKAADKTDANTLRVQVKTGMLSRHNTISIGDIVVHRERITSSPVLPHDTPVAQHYFFAKKAVIGTKAGPLPISLESGVHEQQRLQIQNVLERLYEHDFLAPLEGD